MRPMRAWLLGMTLFFTIASITNEEGKWRWNAYPAQICFTIALLLKER